MLFRNHAFVAATAMLCTLFCATTAQAEDQDRPPVMSKQAYDAAASTPPVFKVTPEYHHDSLPSLRNAAVPSQGYGKRTHFEGLLPLPPGSTDQTDGAVQRLTSPTRNTPTTQLNFDGVGDGFTGPSGTFTVTSAPPDTDGAVGATQYVSLVNTGLAVFDKTTGNAVYGPVPTNTLWSGFGGGCETNNDGDGVVIYDRAANRWVVSQFSVNTTPYLQCVAVSQTSDATGGWNRYAFNYGNTLFPDYPKMGAWPDAYYETFNVFNGNTFSGANLCAYDRTNMLAGNAATQQCYQLSSSFGGVLPSDVDGATPPPANSPNYLINFGASKLNLWKFHVDWTTPGNSTLTGPTAISVSSFSAACSGPGGGAGTCVSQPGTTQQLDSLSDRMMFRLAYRNFGDHESLVASHSVKLGTGTSQYSGVRWYEIRSPGATPTVYQQSTYSPDSSFRWMPSIAMDRAGDIAVGYSVSSNANTVYPSVRYAGRTPSDALSTLETEQSLLAGTASQSGNQGLTRWGDYSAMTIDPVDDCTFWYTNEYIPATGEFNWRTRVGSFRFANCIGPAAKLVFTVEPGASYTANAPIAVKVSIEDVNGNVVTSSTASITVAIGTNPGSSTLSGSATVNAVNGVATFSNLSLNKVGTGYTLTAASTGLTGATSSTFNITAGTASKLVFGQQPTNTTAGSSITPAVTVQVQDASGNVVTTDASTVSLNLSGGAAGATLGGTTSVAAVNGVATFSNLTVNKVGTSYVLNASDGSLTGAASSAFNITAGAPATIAFALEPGPNANITAGSTIPLIANVTDSSGNPVSGDSVTLAIGNNPGSSTLSVTTNPVTTDASGNATFNGLSLNKVGTGYTLTVSNATPLTATSNSFNIVAGAATQLVFTTQPASVVAPSTLNTIAVTEEDAGGNTVTSDSTTGVNFTVSACGGTALGSATMSGGVATLSPAQVFSTQHAGLTVSANDPTLSLSATSQSFNVDNASPSDLLFIDGFETCTL